MPTVEVTSSPLTPSARLKAAVRLTRWLADNGSDPAHVVVMFKSTDPMAYFVGGAPLTSYQDANAEAKQARWAYVVCHIHPGRGKAYCARLAEEAREALGMGGGAGNCLVRFEPTEPERVFYLQDGSMVNAGSVPAGSN
ncbi:MAG: hypothetical protein ACRC20_04840 [Segniliparus sp.]|uniref:hypothetical protein n=1 Tax=Segniliparus sp. TaxID=2804064 RepID=UPI003F32B075